MFIDSSIIIESLKGNQKAIKIVHNLKKENFILYINEVVVSEVLYQLCYRKKYDLIEIYEVLKSSCTFLNVNVTILDNSVFYMKKFNLKPNDALIFSTCKYYNLKKLLTLDSDFLKVSNEIDIIMNLEELL